MKYLQKPWRNKWQWVSYAPCCDLAGKKGLCSDNVSKFFLLFHLWQQLKKKILRGSYRANFPCVKPETKCQEKFAHEYLFFVRENKWKEKLSWKINLKVAGNFLFDSLWASSKSKYQEKCMISDLAWHVWEIKQSSRNKISLLITDERKKILERGLKLWTLEIN